MLPESRPKIFVLDTSVLIHDPACLRAFDEHQVVIPIVVLSELDRLKDDSSRGVNVREVLRSLEEISTTRDITKGVPIGKGSIRVDPDGSIANGLLPTGFDPKKPDNIIIATALTLVRGNPNADIVLVSMDTGMKIIARGLGINAQDYRHGQESMDNQNGSIVEIGTSESVIHQICLPTRNGVLPLSESGIDESRVADLPPITCLRLSADTATGQRKTALVVLNKQETSLTRVHKPQNNKARGGAVTPRNDEQAFAYELALRGPDLVTLSGPAGTGKSLMALLAGWDMIVKKHGFNRTVLDDSESRSLSTEIRMVIFRPTREIGGELGFLPGTMEEKFGPWARPTLSNLKLIASAVGQEDQLGRLLETRGIEILPINHIRGESLNYAYIVVDDAQNLTPHEIKALITRIGQGSRMVITGDPTQVDVGFMNARSNGFTRVVSRFRGQYNYVNLRLFRGERSRLAEMAAEIL